MEYRLNTEHDLTHQKIYESISLLLKIIEQNNIEFVTVLFGFAWGNFFNNWKDLDLSPKDVLSMVDLVESKEYGKLGNDDLNIKFRKKNFWSEITFCHHQGIEWEFINKEEVIFKQILDFFINNFKEIRVMGKIIKKENSDWIKIEIDKIKE